MDEKSYLDQGVLKAMFDQGINTPLQLSMFSRQHSGAQHLNTHVASGLMGIETPTNYGGTGMSFTSSIIVIGMHRSFVLRFSPCMDPLD
jgi:hypothetical protein